MRLIKFTAPALALTTLGLPLLIGCGDSAKPTASTAQQAASAAAPAQHSVTVVSEGAETAPAETVAIFLDSLRKGDERAANGVLTSLARQELAKTDYSIQPLGTPAGQYKIGRVGFPYAEKDIALVECTWTEPATGNSPAEVMDIVCEVHQDTEGWRIAGIGVTIPGTEQALVLDFENAAALQSTIDAVTGQTAGSSTGKIAADQPNQSSNALPALPTFPDASPGGAGTSALPEYPQRIAAPQFGDAPINR